VLRSFRAMAESPVSEGQVLAGKYRVEKVLGSGGMGVVVAAWHLELEQRVAVKFLHPLAMERPDTAERCSARVGWASWSPRGTSSSSSAWR